MRRLIFLALFSVLAALHCDKEFNYYDNYGHGFDVTCQGITQEHLHLLENITISNEITLRIQNSTLRNVSSSIFQNIRNVRYLFIDNSTFTFPNDHSVFGNLEKLEHLLITNTNFVVSKYTFKGLTNLKQLYLLNNNIEEVAPGSFEYLKCLQYLEIADNRLDDIRDIPMCELKQLRTLNLSRNHLFALKRQNFVCKNTLKGMALRLNSLNLNIDQKNYVTINDYSLELTHLDISFNSIKDLGESLNYLKFITLLNGRGNKLTKIKDNEFRTLRDLEEVYLSDNELEVIESKVFAKKENLEIIDLSNNRLYWLNLKDVPLLRDLNLAGNLFNISVLQNITNVASLVSLNLSRNKVMALPGRTFNGFSSLENLDLSKNRVQLNNDSFSGLGHLKTLSLSNNSIDTLPDKLFAQLKSLKRLDLSANKIYFLRNTTFETLTYLEMLNISTNRLESLNYGLLKNLNELHTLDISGNRLKYIQYDQIISNLPLLSVLNIKSNLLTCEFLYQIIKYLKSKHVSYTTMEKFDYERENVAGIYCENEKKAVPSNLRSDSHTGNVLVDISIVVGIILVIVVISVMVFKIYVFLKRRRYRADEFELIHD